MSLSEDYFLRSLKVSPGGVHSPVRAFKSVEGSPLFFKRAAGPTLTSVDEKEYIDFCQSFGPLILGHRDPDVSLVVREAIEAAWSFGACEPFSLELAEFITERIPWVEKVRFVSSGTEAVMSALRVARAATKRNKILKFEGCYHGHVDSLLVKAGSGLAGESVSDSAGVSFATASETFTAPLDSEDHVDKVFQVHSQELAAVIIEPLPANYGLLIQRKEFLQHIASVAKKNGTLLIFDEVISGFRVGMGGMAEILKISPDLVTYGKIIGGGFPVGAYGGRADLMDLVAPQGPVYQAGTLSANPIGMRAGLATLKKIEKEKVYRTLEMRTENFCNQINTFATRIRAPLKAIHFGSVFWLHTVNDSPGNAIRTIGEIPLNHKSRFAKLFHALVNRGVYMAPSGFEVGFLSLAHTEEICQKALRAFEQALKEVYEV